MEMIWPYLNKTFYLHFDFKQKKLYAFLYSDSSDTSEDSQYETSAILARRGVQLKNSTNGILDRFDDDGFNSR